MRTADVTELLLEIFKTYSVIFHTLHTPKSVRTVYLRCCVSIGCNAHFWKIYAQLLLIQLLKPNVQNLSDTMYTATRLMIQLCIKYGNGCCDGLSPNFSTYIFWYINTFSLICQVVSLSQIIFRYTLNMLTICIFSKK